MLDLTPNPAWILVALGTAFAGSLHCAGMCGPLRLLVAEHRHGRALYQAGRLAAYLLLGAAAGALGLNLPPWMALPFLALAGAAVLFPRFTLPGVNAWRARALAFASGKPLLLGFGSGLLPCGLLHAWIAAAAATRSPLGGAGLLAALWLGTSPALELAPWIARRWLQRARGRFPRALPLALLFLALWPVVLRLQPTADGAPACHHEQTSAHHHHHGP